VTWPDPGIERLGLLARRDGSEVWKARRSDGTLAAVKVLTSAAPDRAHRFHSEGVLLRRLGGRHGLIRCIDVLADPPALVLEYLGGGTLADRIGSRPPGLPVAQACAIVASAAMAVDWLHRNDVIHRDVKPSNILLDQEKVRLIDLGVAASGRPPAALPPGFVEEEVGTAGFVAPELIRNPSAATPAVDVYGLGATLYEALTGYLPHDFGPTESEAGYRARIAAGEPSVPLAARGAYPTGLGAVLAAALEIDPGRRLASAAAFAEAVGRSA
jgi:serine/threonine protein kinase